MIFYFHPGDAPGLVIVILLFITIVPLSVALLTFFVIRDVMKWKKSKDGKR